MIPHKLFHKKTDNCFYPHLSDFHELNTYFCYGSLVTQMLWAIKPDIEFDAETYVALRQMAVMNMQKAASYSVARFGCHAILWLWHLPAKPCLADLSKTVFCHHHSLWTSTYSCSGPMALQKGSGLLWLYIAKLSMWLHTTISCSSTCKDLHQQISLAHFQRDLSAIKIWHHFLQLSILPNWLQCWMAQHWSMCQD